MDIITHHLNQHRPDPPTCLPGCVVTHPPGEPFRVCRTITGAATVNDLPPFPDPVWLTVGTMRAVAPAADADLDEPHAVTLTPRWGEDAVLTAPAARALGWALLAAADRIERVQ